MNLYIGEGLSASSWVSQPGGKSDGAIQTNDLAVEHGVFDHVADQTGEFLTLSHALRILQHLRVAGSASTRGAFGFGSAGLVGGGLRRRRGNRHAGVKGARGDAEYADAGLLAQLTGKWEDDAGDGALARAVRELADLAFIGGDRGDHDDDTTLAVLPPGLVERHVWQGQPDQIHSPAQVDSDGSIKVRHVHVFDRLVRGVGRLFGQTERCCTDACAADGPGQWRRVGRLGDPLDRVLDGCLQRG